jgi:hypothetical protein
LRSAHGDASVIRSRHRWTHARNVGLRPFRLAVGIVAVTLVADGGLARARDGVVHRAPVSTSIAGGSVETVYFGDRQVPVRIVRGADPTGQTRVQVETRSFGDGTGGRVTVLRGIVEPTSASSAPPSEIAKPGPAHSTGPDSLIYGGRGGWRGSFPADLSASFNGELFDRIAEAVHGVESQYGTDTRMWRLDNLDGPQGPMQVSAAAAFDVGGGNRFDIYQNILLGRAYLARLFWKYNSWPDALAAYNWGPGNVDQWIVRGRNAAQLPTETTRYIALVLRRALVEPLIGAGQQRISKH